MKPPWREHATLLIGVVGMLVAIFGVYRFFDDRAYSQQLEARQHSLQYVEKYGSADLRSQRLELFEFWLRHSDVIALINREGASPDEYRTFLVTALENHPRQQEMISAIYSISNFYDQVAFCRSSAVCDSTILNSYFCANAADFTRTYGPLAETLSEMSGDTNLGVGAERFARSCPPPTLPANSNSLRQSPG